MMTINMTEIKKRLAKATSGPWIALAPDPKIDRTRWIIARKAGSAVSGERVFLASIIPYHASAGYKVTEDAEFIAHAREDIELLVTEIERLREGDKDANR